MARTKITPALRSADETRTVLSVWLDSDSDPGADPLWIVSRDRLDASGGAITTETLDTHLDRDDALAAAEELSRETGLPVVAEEVI